MEPSKGGQDANQTTYIHAFLRRFIFSTAWMHSAERSDAGDNVDSGS
jgi:hypothetical protein